MNLKVKYVLKVGQKHNFTKFGTQNWWNLQFGACKFCKNNLDNFQKEWLYLGHCTSVFYCTECQNAVSIGSDVK